MLNREDLTPKREGLQWLALPLAVLIGFSVVAAVFWFCVEHLARLPAPRTTPDIITVLLTAASLVLVLLTVFFAVFAILGWAEIKVLIAARVAEVMQERNAEAEGRMRGTAGMSLGLVSVDEDENVLRRDLLNVGISITEEAHRRFVESGNIRLTQNNLNNIAYYLALRYQHDLRTNTESPEDLTFALEIAEELLKDRRKLEHRSESLMTCARVYLLGAQREAKWKRKAQQTITLLRRGDCALSARQIKTLAGYSAEYSSLR